MELRVTRRRVPGSGVSPHGALVAFVLVLVALVAIAGLDRLGVRWPSTAAASPTPTAVPSVVASPSTTVEASATTTPEGTGGPSDEVRPSLSGPPVAPVATPRAGIPTMASEPLVRVAEPAGLVPPGLETISTRARFYWSAVRSSDDAVWASGPGTIARIDPSTGASTSWSIDDDIRFAIASIEPARAGGVWMTDGGSLVRRFDGRAFHDAIDAGGTVTALAEGPGDAVWAVTSTDTGASRLVRFSGSTRTTIDALQPSVECGVASMVVDTRGRVWLAWSRWEDGTSWVSRFDGSAWTVYERLGLATSPAVLATLLATPDGSVWAFTATEASRFDGRAWHALGSFGVSEPRSFVVGADGSVWVAGTGVARWSGTGWANVPIPMGEAVQPVTWLSPTRRGLVYGTDDGAVRGTGTGATGWAWAKADGWIGGGFGQAIVAVSANEALVHGGYGTLEEYNGRSWTGATVEGEYPRLVRAVALGADGDVWAAGLENGLWLRHGGAWSQVDPSQVFALTRDASGRIWVAGSQTTVSGRRFLARAFAVVAGEAREVARTPETDLHANPVSIAVDKDGAIWVATSPDGWLGGADATVEIRRDVAGLWEELPVPAQTERIVDLAVDGDAAVWASGISVSTSGHTTGWIVRRQGDAWSSVWERQDTMPGPFAVSTSGRVWTTLPSGIAVMRPQTTDVVFSAPGLSSVSIAPDGAVWVAGPSGAARLRLTAAALEGSFERR